MATRAATFTAKIRNLKDYHYRMVNNMAPLPSGVDIANTMKYFSQTLLSVLKDIPSEYFGTRLRDSSRLAVLPTLNYSGLYEAVMSMIDVVPLVLYGQHVLGEAILHVFSCLAPFLEYDLLDTLPYTVASTLAIFPTTLQKEIIDLLCQNLILVTMGYHGVNENPTYATDSAAAIIMMVFQYVDNGEYHSQLLECIMSMKKNVFKDLLNVIAYGPPASRAPAVDHLFHYWPQLNPSLSDRRGIHSKYLGFNFKAWKPIPCQREKCPNKAVEAKAVKMCLDPALSTQCYDRPPPLYICIDCVDQLQRDYGPHLVDILQPLERVSLICENKNCTSAKNTAICTCFSTECASRPIRYCPACHQNRHSLGSGSDHIFHETVTNVWSCNAELQGYLVEAIVSLLKEAAPLEEKRVVEMGEERVRQQHFEDDDEAENDEADERKLLSRYAIWLMVELCKPRADIPIEILGRLLAMLFQWFDATAYLPDDNVGTALERLKPEYIYKWLQEVSETHFEVILSCLLPHPVEYAQVGGYWDTLAGRTCQIKEGLNRLFCLLPYDIITYEVWDYVMPFWLEAIRTEVPDDERHELRVLLCKSFETEMCPLPFSVERMYHFVAERFENTTASVQEQNLAWLQILSSLEILIPLPLMLGMFRTGVQSLSSPNKPDPDKGRRPPPIHAQPMPATPTHLDDFPLGSPLSPADNSTFNYPDVEEEPDEPVSNMTCFVMMFDLIIKQMQLQETIAHLGVFNDACRDVMTLMVVMLKAGWDDDDHTCGNHADEEVVVCKACHQSALWHQLAAQVMEFVAPKEEIQLPNKDLPKMDANLPQDSRNPQHRAMNAKGKGHGRKKTKRVVAEKPVTEFNEEEKDFDIPSLPVHLQLLHALLKDLEKERDSDGQFFLLKTMKFLVLHAECLNYTVHDHEHFVRFCLHKLLIPNLFKLLQADRSQMAVFCVPILLHCLTLPSGADIFWKLIEEEFNNEEWQFRFAAVEKVTVLARHMNPESVKHNQVILTTLAHAFCHLIGCLNDSKSAVVQRTVHYLETIKSTALKCLIQCLEFQFDSVISDRCMILQRLNLLQVVMPTADIFTWEFFLNRFDTLCLEAQLDLEASTDVSTLTDLTSSSRDNADHFLKKINRARFALARTDSVRSLTGSILSKPPYRRAASVPHHLISKSSSKVPPLPADTRLDDVNQLKPFLEHLVVQVISTFSGSGESGEPQWSQDSRGGSRRRRRSRKKEKTYPRQQSAPQFGRRDPSGSRTGLTMFSNYMFPGGNLREFTDEESNFAALLQRAMEQEGVDRETIHTLVTLLMKFMVHTDQDRINEDHDMSRAQKLVLRHLNILLGYNQKERAFSVPPYKLRYSAVFNAYLAGLPVVLDKNFALGNVALSVSMMLLQYCPSPQRYASDYQPANYTLWYLEPHSRQTWLKALIIILYKYRYNIAPASATVQTLVRIAINTIDAQQHRCRRHDDMFGPASPVVPRNRDTSNVSIGDLENIREMETPPQSPTDSQGSGGGGVGGDTVTINMAGASTTTTVHYHKKADSEKTEETDVESLSPTSKVTSPITKVAAESAKGSSLPRIPSPPRPSSPSSPISVRPSTRPAFSLGSPRHRAPPLQVASPTDEFAKVQSGQTRRIAEYHSGSVTEVRDLSSVQGMEGETATSSPTYEFQTFPKRTLEESVEEYVRQQVGMVPRPESESTAVTPSSPPGATPLSPPAEIHATGSPRGAMSASPTNGLNASGSPHEGVTASPPGGINTSGSPNGRKSATPLQSVAVHGSGSLNGEISASPPGGTCASGGSPGNGIIASPSEAMHGSGSSHGGIPVSPPGGMDGPGSPPTGGMCVSPSGGGGMHASPHGSPARGSHGSQNGVAVDVSLPDVTTPAVQGALKQAVSDLLPGVLPISPQELPPGAWSGSPGPDMVLSPTGPSPLMSPSTDVSVDVKMAEQLKAFESLSELKRKSPSELPEKSPSPQRPPSPPADLDLDLEREVAIVDVTQTTTQTANNVAMTTNTDTMNGKTENVQNELEELYESESPRRLNRPHLGKARSAGTIEGKTALEEAEGTARMCPERALSETSPSVMEELVIECKSGAESGITESELEDSPCPSPTPQPQPKPNFRPRKARKTGLTTVELQKIIPELSDLGEPGRRSPKHRRSRKLDLLTTSAQSSLHQRRSVASTRHSSDHMQVDRCSECNAVLEQYDEDTISLCIIALATFIHRESALAAPLLPDMLLCVARIAASNPYPWQTEITGLVIPANSVSVARQFLRCALHQLAPNGIFAQLFMSEIEDPDFLKTIAAALVDFADLNCYTALQLLLEGVNETKNITTDQMTRVANNLASYLDCIALETNSPAWANILIQFELFFRRLPGFLSTSTDMCSVLKTMIGVLKIPGITSVKSILEPFSKILSFTLQTSTFKLQQLLDICSLCGRAFTKERDKLYLARCIILELVQALKFKESLPDENLIMLVQFVCMDAGGTIGPISIVEELAHVTYNPNTQCLISTNAAECMKIHLHECVDFIADLHTITKSNFKGGAQNLNEDTLGSHLKAGIAQFVALEFTRSNGRDNRAISRYMPWLYHPPSAMQQGSVNVTLGAEDVSSNRGGTVNAAYAADDPASNSPKEFIDCVGHIRLLSWLLIGSLTHTAITKAAGPIVCVPIPLEASLHIADHVMVIMTGFAEQSKSQEETLSKHEASVLHMSSLFHAFILCQLWTMYCESCAAIQTSMSDYRMAHATIMDFWGRVTPGILQLLSHAKLAEMVNLHFLSLMEALQECNSTILCKLFPMWTPIMFSYHNQLPGHMRVRLQMCQNWAPKETPEDASGAASTTSPAPLSLIHGHSLDSNVLLRWLKRLQFKLGQIEVQSSAATQFYTV